MRVANDQVRGALLGLAAAATFGVSAPLAKLLLDSVPPVLLAGLLYLGAALGLWLHRLVRPSTNEAALGRADLAPLLAVVIAGGIVAPLAMLFGLARTSALAGSLLLNLEAPFTVLLALVLFREHLGRRGWIAVACILAGAAMLRIESGELAGDLLGALLIALACACWAIDNNLTQRLTLRDPFAIVRVKTLVAGLFNVALGLVVLHGELPDPPAILAALALGSVSYGVSVVLDAYALRLVGAAREAAYFASAPFVGALASWLILGDRLGPVELAAMSAMAIGVVALLLERHSHEHRHDPLEHEHIHAHDDHHDHEHGPDDPPGEPHSHAHRHDAIVHEHRHVPDLHHRHRH